MKDGNRVAFYLRVSTDKQTVENQRQELARIANGRGWNVVGEYSDQGVSGTKDRSGRPGLDRMLTDARKAKFDICAIWSLDRISRGGWAATANFIEELDNYGVGLFSAQEPVFDVVEPARTIIVACFSAVAKFERKRMVERRKLGIARAKAAGVRFGRPLRDYADKVRAKKLLEDGAYTIRQIAKETGLSIGTVHRLKEATP